MTTKQKTEREVLEMALVGYNQQLEAVEQKIAEVKAQLGVKPQRRRKNFLDKKVDAFWKKQESKHETPSLGAKVKKGRK